ncbi:MAG: tbp [Nitrososphaeraceae archaeon]|nr:tbp [Nitrososphaeraceae archaeon]
MPQTKPIVSIENVVASATINQTVNLNLITQIFPDVEYHPDQFPGLVFRLKAPKTATLIFSSGKMVCTGAKSKKRRNPDRTRTSNRNTKYCGISKPRWKNPP